MADDSTNILEQAATATQGAIPGLVQQERNMTTFGPTPLVQPPPMPTYKPPESQGNRPTHFETVGSRKRADKQALFSGIANIVKAGTDYIQAKKTRALSLDIQRLMEAQQGLQEAQQMLQQNPNDENAKRALQQNTNIINDITADPKKSKQLQKAFNIDLFGDGKNKQENLALIDAWKQFNQKQQAGDKTALNPIAQRLLAQQPIRQQLDPQAQAQAAAIKAGLAPNANELMKANIELIKSAQTAKSSEARTKAIQDASKLRASTENAKTQAMLDAANIRAYGQKVAAEIAAKSRDIISQRTAATWDKRIKMIESIAADKNTTDKDKAILGSINKEATTLTNQLKNYLQDNEKLQAELDKKGTSIGGIKISAASGADAQLIRIKIGANKAAIEQIQKQLKTVEAKTQMMQQFGVLSLGTDEGQDSPDVSPSEVDVNDDEVPEE